MGYYTEYSLDVNNVETENQFNELNKSMHEMEIIGYALDEGSYSEATKIAYFYPCDSVKWYSNSEDMQKISIQFPDMVFKLEGHGEEFGDFWREYFHNGESEHCRGNLTFEKPTFIQW